MHTWLLRLCIVHQGVYLLLFLLEDEEVERKNTVTKEFRYLYNFLANHVLICLQRKSIILSLFKLKIIDAYQFLQLLQLLLRLTTTLQPYFTLFWLHNGWR